MISPRRVIRWGDKPWLKYAGNLDCQYGFESVISAVNSAAMEVYRMFPDRLDKILVVGDACPIGGDCPGHPLGSHGKLHSFDIDYYTHRTNSTQYGSKIDRTEMYDTNYDDGEVLIDGVFDAERNVALLMEFSEACPNLHARTSNLLLEKMCRVDRRIFAFTQGSGENQAEYNHHMHMHIDLAK